MYEYQEGEVVPLDKLPPELQYDRPLRETFQSPYEDCGVCDCAEAIGKRFSVVGRKMENADLLGTEEETYLYEIVLENGRTLWAHPEEIFVQPEGCWNPEK